MKSHRHSQLVLSVAGFARRMSLVALAHVLDPRNCKPPMLANRRAGVATRLYCTMLLAALLTGCQTRVTSGIACTEERVAFIQPGVTRRDEVSRQLDYNGLNRPQWTWMQGQVIAYVWQTTNGATAGHAFVFFPRAVTWVQQTENAYCIAFDDQDRVIRTTFLKASEPDLLIAAIERWLDVPSGRLLRDYRLASGASPSR